MSLTNFFYFLFFTSMLFIWPNLGVAQTPLEQLRLEKLRQEQEQAQNLNNTNYKVSAPQSSYVAIEQDVEIGTTKKLTCFDIEHIKFTGMIDSVPAPNSISDPLQGECLNYVAIKQLMGRIKKSRGQPA